jgi:hypothetical protein
LKTNLVSAALAIAGTFASAPALALLSSETGDRAGTSIDTVPRSDVVPGLNMTPGYVNSKKLPNVIVICGAMCRQQGAVIFHPNGTEKIFVGGSGPAAMDPGTGAGGSDDNQTTEEKKKQCLANCDTQDKVNKNNCSIANAQYAARLATMPLWGAVTGGFGSFLLFKNPIVAGGGALGGALYGYIDKESRVKDHLSFCLAVAARDNNDCIKDTCHAWLMPLALLPFRRRREEDDEQRLALP